MSFFFFCVPFHFFFSTTIYHDNMVYDWASTDRLGLLIFFGIGYAYSGLSRCVCLAFSLVVSFFFFGDTGGCVFYVLFFPCLFVFTHAPQPFLAVTLGCIFSSFFFYSDEMCDLDTRNSIVILLSCILITILYELSVTRVQSVNMSFSK